MPAPRPVCRLGIACLVLLLATVPAAADPDIPAETPTETPEPDETMAVDAPDVAGPVVSTVIATVAATPTTAWSALAVQEVMAGVRGGLERGAVAHGVVLVSLDADLGAYGRAWRGARAGVSTMALYGRSPSERLLGDALVASNIDAVPTVRLYQAWVERGFGGRAWLRAGSLLADQDFATDAHGALLLNSGFGWPAFISANTLNGGPVFSVPALGARLVVQPGADWTVQAGVYDGDALDSPDGASGPTVHGAHLQLDARQGCFAVVEVSHTSAAPAAPVWKLGAWGHSATFADLDGGSSHGGNGGLYAIAERRLWAAAPRDAGAAVAGWLRGGLAPADRNVYAWAADAGLHATGCVPFRPGDELTLGMVYARATDGARAVAGEGDELSLEAGWAAHVHAHVTLQPDVQWVRHPGPGSTHPDAVAAAVRLTIE